LAWSPPSSLELFEFALERLNVCMTQNSRPLNNPERFSVTSGLVVGLVLDNVVAVQQVPEEE
ncbi:uncharacterized protein JCM15063_004925, partial [Sporobolomyces koalae]|uniref:uncharacterized protein n=1 Tax=Sporobolomyces koalae TaxID=500713 RepID=UPI0031718B7F